VGLVVDKVELGQVFSEYFGFPCQSSFHQLLHNHPHLSSGAGLSPAPPRIIIASDVRMISKRMFLNNGLERLMEAVNLI
jgi:hypothetical protein